VVALAGAVLVLKEALTPLRILGILLLVLGPLLMRNAELPEATSAPPSDRLPKFVPRYAEGYAFALVAAAVYGSTPVLIRLGVVAGDLGSGLVGGLISYAAATLAVALLLAWPDRLRHALAVKREPLKWFTYSGVSVCIAQMFIYMAFTIAPVSVVMPVLQLHLPLRFWLARLLNPQHEFFGGRMLLGTAFSLAGALAISLDSELVLSVVTLPPRVAAALRWHWP
jgi:drug/metabolite transporter (DMT)-like permease